MYGRPKLLTSTGGPLKAAVIFRREVRVDREGVSEQVHNLYLPRRDRYGEKGVVGGDRDVLVERGTHASSICCTGAVEVRWDRRGHVRVPRDEREGHSHRSQCGEGDEALHL